MSLYRVPEFLKKTAERAAAVQIKRMQADSPHDRVSRCRAPISRQRAQPNPARCTGIWFFRPVSGTISSRVTPPSFFRSRQWVTAGLAPPGGFRLVLLI